MAYRQIEGFDNNSYAYLTYSNINLTSPGRLGVGSALNRNVNNATGYLQLNELNTPNQFGSQIGIQFYFKVNNAFGGSTDDGYVIWVKNSSSSLIRVAMNSSFQFRLLGATTGSYGSAVSTGVWHKAWLRGAQSSGTWTLDIDGSTHSTATATTVADAGYISFGHSTINSTTNIEYDDVVVVDNTSAIPDGAVRTLLVTGAGNYTQWTGSYADVDDSLPDDDTTYISTSSELTSTFNVEDLTNKGLIDPIGAIKYTIRGKSPSAAGDINLSTYKSPSLYDYATKSLNTTYSNVPIISNTAPWGGAYTVEALNAAQFGVGYSSGGTGERRVTSLQVQVFGLPAVAQAISGNISSLSAAITKRPGKSLSGAFTQSGVVTMTKTWATALAGAIASLSGSFSYISILPKLITGALSGFSGTIPGRVIGKSTTGIITASANLFKRTTHAFSGSLSILSGSFTYSFLQFKSLTGNLSSLSSSMSTVTTKYKYAIMKAGKVIINYMKGGNA